MKYTSKSYYTSMASLILLVMEYRKKEFLKSHHGTETKELHPALHLPPLAITTTFWGRKVGQGLHTLFYWKMRTQILVLAG